MLSISISWSQITVTNATFPQPGDTLFTVIDNNSFLDLGSAGENQQWNFMSLTGPFVRERLFLHADEGPDGSLFPEADMVMMAANEQDVYLKVSNNRIVEIARTGELIPGIDIPAVYVDQPVFRRAPMSYGDEYEDQSEVQVDLDGSIIPPDLTMGVDVDSLRISINTNSESKMDAWGELMLPGSTHEVLREKVNFSVETKIFVKSFIGWTELPAELLGGTEFANLLGSRNSTIYNFYSNDSKEVLASVVTDEDGNITSTEYMGKMVVNNLQVITADQNEIIAFPNPSFGDVSIEMVNYPLGGYKMKLYNIVGKKLWEQNFDLKPNRVFKADLTHLRKGTYLYSIFDSTGKKLVTKRIAIINI